MSKKRALLYVVLLLSFALLGQLTAFAQEPVVGGTMTVAIASEPDTLDIHMTGNGEVMQAVWLMGATLVARDTEANYHPWLATEWTTSEDGMTWEFKLREDVTFHNGKPLTANEYAWTINRLLAPETAAPQAGRLRAVANAEAVDDYTLRLNMAAPFPLLLEQLSNTGVVQPYDPEYVENADNNFGRTFMGVGPYRFVEWVTGDRLVLERNPDFNWGPEFMTNQGAYNIERIVFRIIPETATVLAGLEAGEIDYAVVPGREVSYLESLGTLNILESNTQGMNPSLHMNLSLPPFDDLRVRQAFNLAVDRETLITVAAEGLAIPQYGPLSSNINGYDPTVEEIGYHYDLDAARALMAEAGYTVNAAGLLEKDGAVLTLPFTCTAGFDTACQVIQAQFAELGVTLEIQVVDAGTALGALLGHQYTVMLTGYSASESDILYRWFHTSRPGALNPSNAPANAELDAILDATRTDLANRAEHVNEAQRFLVENAWVVPLYNPSQFTIISKRVNGFVPNPRALATMNAFFNDAYISE